jgi:DNA-binding transcriptional LysR family regulator
LIFETMRYVYQVYKEKSFSKAAQKLFISQPSLSATVKRVEDKIGYPIFDRSTKPLTLTECGARYIQAVEQIMAIENDFETFINDWGDLKTGQLKLGGSALYSSWVFPPLVGRFTAKYPQVTVELIERRSPELTVLLQKGLLDLTIDNSILDKESFDRKVFRVEHLLLTVPANLPVNVRAKAYQIPERSIEDGSFLKQATAPVPLEWFDGESFVLLKPNNNTRTRADALFEKYGITPKVAFELDQQFTSYNVSCTGAGISFISDTLIARVPANPRVVFYKLDKELSTRKIYFYWKAGRYVSRAMEEFFKLAEEKAL